MERWAGTKDGAASVIAKVTLPVGMLVASEEPLTLAMALSSALQW